MMDESEFISLMTGKPWINRGDSVDGADCYGLVKLYNELVQGKTLPVVTGYKEGFKFDSLWRKEINKTWWQVGKWQQGAMVTFYDNAHNPVHVGICVGNQQILHSPGTEEKPGKVSIHKLATLMGSGAYKNATFHKVVKHA